MKTPWKIEEQGQYVTVVDKDGQTIPELTDIELGWADTSTGNYQSPEESYERVAFIVRACNSHNELLEALKQATTAAKLRLAPHLKGKADGITDYWLEIAEIAIAKAEGK